MKQLFACIIIIISLAACGQKSEIQILEEKFDESSLNSSSFDPELLVEKPDSVLRHVVFFSFKAETSEEEINTVVDAFRELKNKIPGIISFEWGVNSSPEGLNRGLTHAFTLTFFTAQARDEYLPHTSHKEFGEILGPHLDQVLVVDYWARP